MQEKGSKCKVLVRCKNNELKDMVLNQYLNQVPIPNRKAFIKSNVKVLGDTNDFKFSLRNISSQIPVLMYGYKEGISTEKKANKSNNFEVVFKCKDETVAKKISKFVHNQFLGLKEYIDNNIVLCTGGDEVIVLFGAECDYYPIFLFIEEGDK